MEVALFLALLAVGGQAALVLLLVAWATGRLGVVREALAGRELALAWVVAATATAGSLYFSEVRDFPPCQLCWYQRIGMYPLVVLLGIAALRRDAAVWRYALPLAAGGAAFAVYHVQLERFPEQESGFCTASVPCTTKWIEELGYVTIPVLALTAFALVGALLLLARARHE